jgi:1-phosphofructokinase/tagatose 6-phosphate kinase
VILTVTLNAAIDRTVEVPNFRQGRRHRAVERRTTAGGKGVNVARAIKLLGKPVIATGLAGGPTGSRLLERLAEESILCDFTPIADESRTNLAVIDPTSGEQTEVNERGPEVDPAEVDNFVEKLLYLAQGATICVLAGSVPPGVDSGIYARLIPELSRLGVTTLLDAEGESMRAGLKAGPSVVTPNVGEAEELVGHEFEEAEDAVRALHGLAEIGAGEAIITRPDGCVAAVGPAGSQGIYEVSIDPLEPVATVGSGDAFLAGYAAARYDGAAPRECLAYAVACGAESTQHFGAGTVDPAEVERQMARVEVREIEAPVEVG